VFLDPTSSNFLYQNMNALPSLPLLDHPSLHMKVSVKKETNVYFNHQFRSIRPSRPLSATRSGEAAGSQSAQYTVLTEMEFLDINSTKDLSLLLHAIHSLSIGRFL
jgi:hypothetical protein